VKILTSGKGGGEVGRGSEIGEIPSDISNAQVRLCYVVWMKKRANEEKWGSIGNGVWRGGR
jgi:hypothetical protein